MLFRLREQHANGSTFEASGRKDDVLAARAIWLEMQEDPEPEEIPEPPKMVGTQSSMERAARYWEIGGNQDPIIKASFPFGFVPNDENEQYFGGNE